MNSTERYVSDVLPLDVAGTTLGQGGILNPRTQWAIEELPWSRYESIA